MWKFLNKKTISFITAVLLIFIMHYVGVLQVVENYLISFLKPVEKVVFEGSNKVQTYYDEKTDKRDLYAINKKLEEDNQNLLVENVELKVLEDENKALREQIKFYSKYKYEKVVANIINKSGDIETGHTITLDKGRVDSIAIGQGIVSGNGIIVGKIFAVQEKISHGYLITDKNCKIAAVLSDKTATTGITTGDLGLTVKMDYIPQTEEFNIDDLVITSGLESKIPKGLIIGKIKEIQRETNDLFQTAVINPALNLDTILVVSIIIN